VVEDQGVQYWNAGVLTRLKNSLYNSNESMIMISLVLIQKALLYYLHLCIVLVRWRALWCKGERSKRSEELLQKAHFFPAVPAALTHPKKSISRCPVPIPPDSRESKSVFEPGPIPCRIRIIIDPLLRWSLLHDLLRRLLQCSSLCPSSEHE
jgi:hypothetical protein